jgi:hypothetical protein
MRVPRITPEPETAPFIAAYPQRRDPRQAAPMAPPRHATRGKPKENYNETHVDQRNSA